MRCFIGRAALPAALLSLGIAFATLPTAQTFAAEKIDYQAKKLNAEQLLDKQGQAVQFILKNFKEIPKEKRGKSAPLLKALASTAKHLKEVRSAAAAKDSRKFAASLPELASAIAQVNLTYKLSGLKDKKVKLGVKMLNKTWDAYLKRVKGGKAEDAQALATKNSRRIHEMQARLDKMAANAQITKRQKREIEQLQQLLHKASAANKRNSQQWYTVTLIANFEGYYAGYYYWYAAYDPQNYDLYRDSWEYFSTSSEYFYSESYSYYESYSWESYEVSVETSESYDFDYTAEEYQSFESEYESSEETLDASAGEEYAATDEDQQIESAEDYDSPEAIDDPADEPDPEADAEADMDDDQASAADDGDDSYMEDDGGDDLAAADDSGADEMADGDNADDAAANDDSGDETAASEDDGHDDNSMDDGGDGDDGGADGGGADDGDPDDGGADEGGEE